jgi:hypothetical protein
LDRAAPPGRAANDPFLADTARCKGSLRIIAR